MTKNLSEKIGIIGIGFVGGAISKSLSERNIVRVDQDPSKGCTGTYAELLECSGIFVCVPSPQNDDGSCNTSILESVLDQLVGFNGVIISKTTATPDVYERLNAKYKNLVHAPEFLTAANADEDYAKGRFAVIGGNVPAYVREAERIIKMSQYCLHTVWHCSIGEAALMKYAINSFLATKVVFMNEIASIAKAANLDYASIVNMLDQDPRIGQSHMRVPGPDGSLGYGGMCFPKDTTAFLKYAESINCQMNVLDAAVKKNLILRLTEPK